MMKAFHRASTAAAHLAAGLLASTGLAACSAAGSQPAAVRPPAPALLVSATTDKAAYAPGSTVLIKADLSNQSDAAIAGARLTLTVRHLEQDVGPPVSAELRLDAGAAGRVQFAWTAPATDFQGYSFELAATDSAGKPLASGTGAIDISSNWLKFPRYGYVSQYAAGADAQAVVEQLKAYHINALQFYDWQWKHHLPLKGSPTAVEANWHDIANRTVSRDTVRKLIDAAHQAGMAAMAYNLIYGAAINYQQDGVSPAWGLYDAPGGKQWQYSLPSSWATPGLYFFNPANAAWQDYLIGRELEVFQAFSFDGWHADTVGDNGIKYDAHGDPVDIKDTFKPFLNAAKARLGSKLLMMNAVGNKGHLQVNTSKVDAVYVEVWPWEGFPDYLSLKNVVDQARQESGGKSLIVPAYLDYDYAKTKSEQSPGQFNDHGVLLTEATVLAAGGSRLELGDDGRMLCSDYFPNRALAMSPALKAALQRYYDFAVAYENLLRDGQAAAAGTVSIAGQAVSADGQKDTVWAFAKADARYETINLVNLKGLVDVSWRDTNATQQKPAALGSFTLRYYSGAQLERAWVASPDAEGGRSRSLPLAHGADARGAYVEVTVPGLEYWNLIYFRKTV
ncbi:glycoside hydrolase family 66 protein [Massilia terrae]|uniref:Glycoside hydrolase family 66 protein n=1 Tax=Massilia terrae TaxID=1811224 RepID=A0ABT2D4R7_9BURK|nr:glycoside hydrolase family 66 protein [Massilia terrae]MCS0661186.1 glycoside hydrolase family 66 protein [Massilia terrae]